MQFGTFGSASARRGSGELGSTEGYHDWIEYNVEAEALGLRSAFCVEHHFTGSGQVSATLNLLTWLGARTTRLRLGTAVTVLPWHNPVLLADFGIGTGYRYNEFHGFDVALDEARERFEESIDVILKAWTSNEPFSHAGKYWTFRNIVVEPQSFRRPHPAVWMGAGGERSIRDVARRGFNLLLGQYSSPADVARNIAIYREAVEAKGEQWDPMRVGVTRAFFVTDDPRERDAALERRLANRRRLLKLGTTPDGRVLGGPDRADGDPVEINLASAIYGPPDEIARRIEALREAGAGYLLLSNGAPGGGERGRQSLRRFAREVMPAFATTR
jgi:alkanesulfonate monooxygenase SsuD/methylene tetrahydromethanopterin reductase-like flavin-dependent oxidoreductase (luciferase family)